MPPERPKSPKERRDSRNARSFTGRTKQQDQFQRSLLQPNHSDAKIIFSISGQGGVGKTTLLKEFRRITEEHGHMAAYIDEGVAMNHVDDVPEAMHRLAEDLEGQGIKFDRFREQYKAYRIKRHEIEADPEAPKELLGDATRGVIKGALELGKSQLPVVGEMIDSDMVATKAGELMNYSWERFRNKDEERLMKETLEVLTPLWLEGMRRIPIEKTLVLMLDTYEITGSFLDEWVRALLDEEFGRVERSLLVCIAGRQTIDRNAWIEWESVIARSPLEPFTESETRQFLASQGVRSAAVIDEIWRLSSGGLPLLVSMMAQNAPTDVDTVVDYCDLAVERFLKWVTDDVKRQLAQDGSLPRVLNEDVVAALKDGQFDWLKNCAFVMRDGERWRYHLVVREQMLRYHLQKSPKRWTEVHEKLAAYYDHSRNELKLETGKEAKDKLWRELSLEWLYHELCAVPQAKIGTALNGFLIALKESRGFAQNWAAVMVQAGQEARCKTLQQWGERLKNAMVSYQEKCYEETISSMTALLVETVIEPKLKAVALYWRGSCYDLSKQEELAFKDLQQVIEIDNKNPAYWFSLGLRYENLGQYEEAVFNYKQAIELDPEFKRAIAHCGEACRLMKRYEEALSNLDKAIGLDINYHWAISSRGQTYQALSRYEEALKDFNRAIDLDPESVWKIAKRGQTYQALSRYEEALKDFNRAIDLDPESVWKLEKRGRLYQELNRYNEALKDFERVLEIKPDNVLAQEKVGILQYQLENYEASLQSFQKAHNLRQNNSTCSSNLAYLYLLRGDVNKSRELIEAVVNNKPFDRAWLNLGLIQAQQNEIEVAKQSWQRGLNLMNNESDWNKAVRYVFTVALGNSTTGLEQMQHLINSDVDKVVLRNALNDVIILSRSQQSLEGIEEMLQLLQGALS